MNYSLPSDAISLKLKQQYIQLRNFKLFVMASILNVGGGGGARIERHNFESGPSTDHASQVWFNLAQWFQNFKILELFIITMFSQLYVKIGIFLICTCRKHMHGHIIKLRGEVGEKNKFNPDTYY